VAVGGDDSRAVTEPANRFATRLYRTDPLPDLVAEHCDPAIGRAEMFQTMHRDRALRHLRLEVLRPALAFLIGGSGELPRQHDIAVGPPVRRDDALGHADVTQFDQHRMVVVERHDPATHHRSTERMRLLTVLPDRRNLLQVWQYVLHHARPDIVANAPG